MGKRVLILVLSSDFEPYNNMIINSIRTWDSISIDGVETIFYCSQKDNPNWKNTDKVMYFDVPNDLYSMGKKNLAMYEWALKNKEFDFIARINASCFVDKKRLIEYVQTLPDTNLFAGAEADSVHGYRYVWGGGQYLISKDVVQKIVDCKDIWNHTYMEDESMSLLVASFGIPFTPGYSGAIDNMGDYWRIISYGGESISFTEFGELKRLKHHFYRVKIDQKRWLDEFIMLELFKVLQ